MSNSRSRIDLRTWVTMAMLTAIAYVVMYLSKMLPQVAGFLQMDLKDTVICIGGFIFGPLAAAIMSILVAVIEMFTASDTGLIGCIMNLISTSAFCCIASFLYKRFHTRCGAIISLSVAVIVLTCVMVLWNYLITPLYMVGATRDMIVDMLPTVFIPFNLVKGGLNMAAILLLYKPIVTALRKAHLAPETRTAPQSTVTLNGQSMDAAPRKRLNAGFLLFSLALLATFVTLALVLWGII